MQNLKYQRNLALVPLLHHITGLNLSFYFPDSSSNYPFRVDVHVQSVAKYIPNEDNNESQFIGVVPVSKNGNGMTKFSGSGSSSSRARQVEQQLKDAEQRVVAWNAEDSRWTDEDAEGEVDYDYVNDSGIALSEPLGIRKDDGSIVPIEDQEENGMETDQVDAQFFGEPELAPSRVGKLVSFFILFLEPSPATAHNR